MHKGTSPWTPLPLGRLIIALEWEDGKNCGYRITVQRKWGVGENPMKVGGMLHLLFSIIQQLGEQGDWGWIFMHAVCDVVEGEIFLEVGTCYCVPYQRNRSLTRYAQGDGHFHSQPCVN